ncbi:MAG: hypothetical protein QOD99_61 [Chthoniobacter sp.]|jgi:uncharacterized protein|nr:hypothetical protein [Chthoniobacter sp.]
MKIHLRQIAQDGLHIEGDEDADFLDLAELRAHALTPVHYALDVGLSEGGIFATGMLSLDLHLECVSCLEPFAYALRIHAFAMQSPLDGRETVDLTPFVREDILLALPPYPHCDWDGEHACPGAARSTTDVSGESHAWDALDQLKIKQSK